MWRWRYRGLVALVVALGLVTGCGGSDSSTDNSATSVTSDTSVTSETGTSEDEALAWVPFGPNDPTSPTPSWPMYSALAEGDCSTLEAKGEESAADVGELGRAMVAVCRAAVDGRQDQWEVAQTAFDAGSGTLSNTCLEPKVRELLARALAWHQDHPDRTPRFQRQTVGGDGKTECAPDTTDTTDTTGTTEPTDPTDPTVTDSTPETSG